MHVAGFGLCWCLHNGSETEGGSVRAVRPAHNRCSRIYVHASVARVVTAAMQPRCTSRRQQSTAPRPHSGSCEKHCAKVASGGAPPMFHVTRSTRSGRAASARTTCTCTSSRPRPLAPPPPVGSQNGSESASPASACRCSARSVAVLGERCQVRYLCCCLTLVLVVVR